jgi:hypothetical protein
MQRGRARSKGTGDRLHCNGSDEMEGGAPLDAVLCAMIPVLEQANLRSMAEPQAEGSGWSYVLANKNAFT